MKNDKMHKDTLSFNIVKLEGTITTNFEDKRNFLRKIFVEDET